MSVKWLERNVFAAVIALSACSGHVIARSTGANCSDAQCASGGGTSAEGGRTSSGGGTSAEGGRTSSGGASSSGGIGGSGAGTTVDGSAGAFTGTPGAVGDVFVPDEENSPGFSGYSSSEVNVTTRYDGCASGVGIAVHFQGRVGCPYGQPADPKDPTQVDPAHQTCFTPSGAPVTVPVPPQYVGRPSADYVYCSCRCDGPLKGKEIYCACPDGFACEPLVPAYDELDAGSYCQKPETLPSQDAGAVCARELMNCGPL